MIFFSKHSKIHIIITIVAVLMLFSSVTGFFKISQIYYYVSLVAFGVILLLSDLRWSIGLWLIGLFLLICFFSILINDPPSYFRAWERWLAFVFSLSIVSPLFVSKKSIDLRRRLFGSIIILSIALSVASFFCYFLGINYFTVSDEVFSIEAGRFAGLFSQSMLLGPIASLSAIFSFSSYLEKKGHHSIIWLILLIMCVGSVLFSASRSALAGCVFGLMLSFIRFYRGHMSRGVIIGFCVVGILVASYPLWGDWTDFVLIKQQHNIDGGGTFMSREDIWLMRLSEIRQYPLTGIGFCCVDTGLSYVDVSTGILEPGSSWLAVFSMTGVFGFCAFLVIFIGSFLKAFRSSDVSESCVLSGSLAFFIVHLIFEGYVLAVGSFLGLMYWLLLGCVWGKKIKSIS